MKKMKNYMQILKNSLQSSLYFKLVKCVLWVKISGSYDMMFDGWGNHEQTHNFGICLWKIPPIFKGKIFWSYDFWKQRKWWIKIIMTSTTPSCSGPIPAQKSRGNSVHVLGVVFSHTMSKMDFHYSHHFSWEKTH